MSPAATATSFLRILLVEDERLNQKVALRMLESLGYRAHVAENGREAIKALEENPYDVVLMDVRMPIMNGLEATRAICKRWERHERPRIFALTSSANPEDCLAAGMDGYLSKPVVRERLAETLRGIRPFEREAK